ncbi:MAG: RcpC/CpaB family pilus assembly protein, partial [Actinomycetota bacterium]
MGRRTLVLVIALALAAISGYAVWQYLSSVDDSARQEFSEVEVYRAIEPIATGTLGEEAKPLIEASTALRNQVVFENSTILCTGAVGTNADLDPNQYGCVQNPNDLDLVLNGKVAAGPIAQGQLITAGSFADTRDLEQTLSQSIAPGKVAISISVDPSTASGGFVRPGDNVNILASTSLGPLDFLEIISNDELRDLLIEVTTLTDEQVEAAAAADDETGPPQNLADAIAGSFDFTQTILQDVQVLAVGASTRPAPIGAGLEPVGGVIVFEVTPQDAEKIEFARQYTSIALSLLPTGDYVPYDSQP